MRHEVGDRFAIPANHKARALFLDLRKQPGELRLGLVDVDRFHPPELVRLVRCVKRAIFSRGIRRGVCPPNEATVSQPPSFEFVPPLFRVNSRAPVRNAPPSA